MIKTIPTCHWFHRIASYLTPLEQKNLERWASPSAILETKPRNNDEKIDTLNYGQEMVAESLRRRRSENAVNNGPLLMVEK